MFNYGLSNIESETSLLVKKKKTLKNTLAKLWQILSWHNFKNIDID